MFGLTPPIDIARMALRIAPYVVIALLLAALFITRGTLATSREQTKNEKLLHGITLASLKGATVVLKKQTADIRELDRLGQERKAKAAVALQEAEREGARLKGSVDALRASAAVVRPVGAPCTVSDAVRAVEGKL